MLFKEFDKEGDWVCVEYAATWKYGYDFMLDAAQAVLGDLKDNVQRFAKYAHMNTKPLEILEEIKKLDKIRDCEALKDECGAIAVAGVSGIMECPIQLVFFNQTNVVRLDCPIIKIFDDHGEHVFDNYMNSIEIKAYCADTERRTIARLGKERL